MHEHTVKLAVVAAVLVVTGCINTNAAADYDAYLYAQALTSGIHLENIADHIDTGDIPAAIRDAERWEQQFDEFDRPPSGYRHEDDTVEMIQLCGAAAGAVAEALHGSYPADAAISLLDLCNEATEDLTVAFDEEGRNA